LSADTTAILKKDERNPMNHITKISVLEKESGGKMFVGTYGLFAHSMSMIATVGKHLLGNRVRL